MIYTFSLFTMWRYRLVLKIFLTPLAFFLFCFHNAFDGPSITTPVWKRLEEVLAAFGYCKFSDLL